MQLATGHGNFGKYLKRFKLRVGECKCKCGAEEESIEHVRDECELNERKRVREEGEREWIEAGHTMPMSYEGDKRKKELIIKIISQMGDIMIEDETETEELA